MVKNFATVTAVLLAMLVGAAVGAGPTFAQPAPQVVTPDEAKEDAALYADLRVRLKRQNDKLNAALAEPETLKTMQHLMVIIDEMKMQSTVYADARKAGKGPELLGDVIKAFGDDARTAHELHKSLTDRLTTVCNQPDVTIRVMAEVTFDLYVKAHDYLQAVMDNAEKSCELLHTPGRWYGRTWNRAFQLTHDRRKDQQMSDDEAFFKAAGETLETSRF